MQLIIILDNTHLLGKRAICFVLIAHNTMIRFLLSSTIIILIFRAGIKPKNPFSSATGSHGCKIPVLNTFSFHTPKTCKTLGFWCRFVAWDLLFFPNRLKTSLSRLSGALSGRRDICVPCPRQWYSFYFSGCSICFVTLWEYSHLPSIPDISSFLTFCYLF